MRDFNEVLRRARNRKTFGSQAEFKSFLRKIQAAKPALKINWDDEAGEEWAWIVDKQEGDSCLLNVKVGIAFVRSNYENPAMMDVLHEICVERTDDYDADEWAVDKDLLHKEVPEIFWHMSEDAVNPKAFCLSDMYVATV